MLSFRYCCVNGTALWRRTTPVLIKMKLSDQKTAALIKQNCIKENNCALFYLFPISITSLKVVVSLRGGITTWIQCLAYSTLCNANWNSNGHKWLPFYLLKTKMHLIVTQTKQSSLRCISMLRCIFQCSPCSWFIHCPVNSSSSEQEGASFYVPVEEMPPHSMVWCYHHRVSQWGLCAQGELHC